MSRDLEKCPRSLLVFERSNFMNENSRHDVHVFNHKFNYKVSLLIPDCGVLPVEIEKVISNFSTYYLVRDLPVYKFLEGKFLETAVKTDRFLALSYKTQIDEENVVAFLPGGKLILSVDKDTYQQLGLEGKPLQCNHKKLVRYVVTVDLTDKSLLPGTKRYQHVLSGLKERVPLKSDFLLTRCHTGEEKDEAFQGLLSQYTYEECRPTFNSHNLKNLLCPSVHSSDLPGKSISCTPNSFLEWLGAVNLNITNDSLPASFLSSYVCPEPCSSVSDALLCTVTGLIPPENVYSLIQELRQLFEASQFTSWVSLTVHGFMDSPVSWRAAEHGLNGGENLYNFVCFKNQDYWLHMPTGLLSACPT